MTQGYQNPPQWTLDADTPPHAAPRGGSVELPGLAGVAAPVEGEVGGHDAAARDRGDVRHLRQDAGVSEETEQAQVIEARPEAAAGEGLSPLQHMRKYGAFEVKKNVYGVQNTPLVPAELEGTSVDEAGRVLSQRDGKTLGVVVDGKAVVGFPTPSRKLEFFSGTMKDWSWPEYALPGYIPSHVHWSNLDREKGEYVLIPTFRLPTLIHTRSGNSKWLNEISHSNPLWIATPDAKKYGIQTGDLVKVHTAIGYFVTRAWVTEGIRPGILGMSHHLGRWRLHEEIGLRNAAALVTLDRPADGQYRIRQVHGTRPFDSHDPDSRRVWWTEVGVHQNLTFPVQPDPVSGMHCWHQKVRLEKAGPNDQYGDIFVDTNKSHEIYKQWMKMTRPAPGPGGLRRPTWFDRPLRPVADAYRVPEAKD